MNEARKHVVIVSTSILGRAPPFGVPDSDSTLADEAFHPLMKNGTRLAWERQEGTEFFHRQATAGTVWTKHTFRSIPVPMRGGSSTKRFG